MFFVYSYYFLCIITVIAAIYNFWGWCYETARNCCLIAVCILSFGNIISHYAAFKTEKEICIYPQINLIENGVKSTKIVRVKYDGKIFEFDNPNIIREIDHKTKFSITYSYNAFGKRLPLVMTKEDE